MSEKDKKNNKKSNNLKIYIRFALIMIACLIAGFFVGMGTSKVEAILSNEVLAKNIMTISTYLVPALFVGMHVICACISFISYSKCKSTVKSWDGNDEDVIDQVEVKLNVPVTIANVCLVLNFAFFPILVHIADQEGINAFMSDIIFFITIIFFILGYVWIVAVTNLVVNLEKELNPEKKGNIFDTKFQKDWEDSCDEAQKLIIYKAGYSAYKLASKLCIGLWLIGLLLEFITKQGVIPILFVCCIWLCMTIAYTKTCTKLEAPSK